MRATLLTLSAVLLAGLAAITPAQAQFNYSPDAAGYYARDDQTPGPPNEPYLPQVPFVNIQGHPDAIVTKNYAGQTKTTTNDWRTPTQGSCPGGKMAPFPLKAKPSDPDFLFEYYGERYTGVYVHENGFISFTGPEGGAACTGQNDASTATPRTIPSGGTPRAIGAGAWSNYGTNCAGMQSVIHMLYRGVAPMRQVVFQWTEMAAGSCLGFSTFQIIIDECGDALEYHYSNQMGGASRTHVGTIDHTGTKGMKYHESAANDQQLKDRRVRITANDCPTANPDFVTVSEDVRTPLLVLMNDKDFDNDAMKIVEVTDLQGNVIHKLGDPAGEYRSGRTKHGGWAEVHPSGVFVYYIPPTDQHSGTLPNPDQFRYVVEDAAGKRSAGVVTAQILARNDPPRLRLGPTILGVEDSPLDVVSGWTPVDEIVPGPPDEVAAKQRIIQYGALAVDPTMFADDGQPTFDAAGTVTYKPRPDRCTGPAGTPVDIIMKDDGGTSNGGKDTVAPGALRFHIVIACERDPPVAVPDVGVVILGGGASSHKINLVANDEDADLLQPGGDELRILDLRNVDPARGSATIDADGKHVQYTPAGSGSGLHLFEYRAVDKTLHPSNWAEVELRVVCKELVLQPDGYVVQEDTPRLVPAGDLLANDAIDPAFRAGTLLVSVHEAPKMGSITMQTNGAFRYVPNPHAYGTDSFRYQVVHQETGCRDVVRVQLAVADANDPPTLQDDFFTLLEDSLDNALDVLQNDSTKPDPPLVEPYLNLTAVGPAQNGNVRIEGGKVVYRAKPDFAGTDSFWYEAKDNRGGTATANVRLRILPLPDAPRGVPDSYVMRRNQPNQVDVTMGVLANDQDPDGEDLTAHLVAPPGFGRIDLGIDGSFLYVPLTGFAGQDSFTYTVRDATGRSSPPTTVQLMVGDNAPPVADFAVQEGQLVVNRPVQFYDRSRDPDGFLLGHRWEFGDGKSSEAASPRHNFTQPGSYTIRLSVVDNDGRLGTATRTVQVVDGYDVDHGGALGARLPVADGGPDRDAMQGSLVVLEGRMVEGLPVTAQWRQVAGPAVMLVDADRPTAMFTAPPVGADGRPVRLAFEFTVFDGVRSSLPDEVVVQVFSPVLPPSQPRLDAGLDRSVVLGERVELFAKVDGLYPDEVAQVTWRQVSGPSVGPILAGNPTYAVVPGKPGDVLVFEAVTSVRDTTLRDELRLSVLTPQTRDGFDLERGRGRASNAIRVTALLPGEVRWDFGDGTTSTERSPVHVYSEGGRYLVTLTVTGEDGATQTFTKEVRVHAAITEAPAKASPGAPLLLVLGALALAAVRRRMR